MTQAHVQEDIAYLTETLRSPIDQLILLRPSLEAALFKLGHSHADIEPALNLYYNARRTVH
jgi:hypothetical protein